MVLLEWLTELFKIVPIILSFYYGHLLLLMFFILPIQPLVESVFRRYFTNNINIDINQGSVDQSSNFSTKVYWKGPKMNDLPKFSTLVYPLLPSIPQDECSSKMNSAVENVSSMALAYQETAYWDEFILVSNSVVHSRALYQARELRHLSMITSWKE